MNGMAVQTEIDPQVTHVIKKEPKAHVYCICCKNGVTLDSVL